MSLTILPQTSSVGFSPQNHSARPQSHLATGGTPQADSNKQVSDNQTDPSIVKIISDDNDVSADSINLANLENKIRVRIDPESKEVIVEVVNNKTGEKVLQIPGEQRLRLSKGISQYYSVAFNQER